MTTHSDEDLLKLAERFETEQYATGMAFSYAETVLAAKALRHSASASTAGRGEVVAWRWRYKDRYSKGWDYSDKEPKFAAFNTDTIDCEPLYASPPTVEPPTIDSVPSCGQENDYRRAASAAETAGVKTLEEFKDFLNDLAELTIDEPVERALRAAREYIAEDNNPKSNRVLGLIADAIAPADTSASVVGDREAIAFEFYCFSYPNRWDTDRRQMWEAFQACRGSITWDRCIRAAAVLTSQGKADAGSGVRSEVLTARRMEQAERALIRAGFTLQEGAQEWKPPLGPSASPLLDEIARLRGAAQAQPKWRHLKRGSIVTEVARGFAQVAHHPIEEMTCVVIYRHDEDGRYWVRNAVEFDDGRFESYPVPSASRGTEA